MGYSNEDLNKARIQLVEKTDMKVYLKELLEEAGTIFSLVPLSPK